MEVLHPRCAGLDVHKDTVVACVRVVVDGHIHQEVRTFGTTTAQLLTLADWLRENECTHAAMESTGVYWKPVWHILEDSLTLVLANAMHIKNVPGRKTDVNDAMWIADLLAHGLIRGSFVPPTPVQEMRDLTRTRKQLVREVAQHTQRLQKTLEDANIKLASFISDVLGTSGRAILEAIANGEVDPEKLAELTTGRLRASRAELVEALRGNLREHHRFLLRLHLDQIDALHKAVREVEARLGNVLDPFRDLEGLLMTIPGVSKTTAQVILSEVGTDMSRFATVGNLISWAGLCPGSDESAGKRRSNRLRKGGQWLKATLVQSAWAAARKKGSYLKALFQRIRSRRGPKKAAVAVAASMLTAAYHMLKTGVVYQDLSERYFDARDQTKVAKRLIKRLADLGLRVEISPLPGSLVASGVSP
jgi:transposase